MVAVITTIYIEIICNLCTAEVHTATASFVTETCGSSYCDAGSIKLNSKALKLNTIKSRAYDN